MKENMSQRNFNKEKKILKKILGLHAHRAHIKNPDLEDKIIKIIKGDVKNGNSTN